MAKFISEKYKQLHTSILVGKTNHNIEFSPVAKMQHGVFITHDKKLEDAMLKDKRNGKVWSLLKAKAVEKKPDTGPVIVKVDEVTNITDAKKYLADKFDVSPTDMPTKESIFELAKQNNIEFPNWKAE